MSGTFVPEQAGVEIAEAAPPRAWRQIEAAPKAMSAERGAVQVTLRPKQGEPAKVTLTGIEFKVGFHLPRHSSPIRFPWTVSLTKPLHLYLAAQARDVYADWTARIAWTSGSSHGVIQVDNGGRKYRIVDGQGTGWYRPGPDGQWEDSGSSRWIGVR